MTAEAKPGQRVGGGMPNCCVREHVFEEGVQLGLLLLPLALKFLCAWLG